MAPDVKLADETIARLQKIAVPLTDSFDSVINRVLDTYEATNGIGNVQPGKPVGALASGVMKFDGANAPQLKFATCTRITVNGTTLPKQITYWNNLLIRLIEEVAAKGHDAEAILAMMSIANAVAGKREINGYKFISKAGISVQGAEANAAFKQAYELASSNGIKFSVEFAWQDNERAAYPNQRGYIEA